MESTSTEARYSVDQATHQTVIAIYDPNTERLIREIPAEKIRELQQSLEKLAEPKVDSVA